MEVHEFIGVQVQTLSDRDGLELDTLLHPSIESVRYARSSCQGSFRLETEVTDTELWMDEHVPFILGQCSVNFHDVT